MDFGGNPISLRSFYIEKLNRSGIRYMFPCDDKKFSCTTMDFSINEMWKKIKIVEEETLTKIAVKKYRKNDNG